MINSGRMNMQQVSLKQPTQNEIKCTDDLTGGPDLSKPSPLKFHRLSLAPTQSPAKEKIDTL